MEAIKKKLAYLKEERDAALEKAEKAEDDLKQIKTEKEAVRAHNGIM